MKHIFLAERFGEQEYTVNGVRYIVGSSFQSSITSTPSIGISISLVAPITRVTPEVVVKPGTTSVRMPLNRW